MACDGDESVVPRPPSSICEKHSTPLKSWKLLEWVKGKQNAFRKRKHFIYLFAVFNRRVLWTKRKEVFSEFDTMRCMNVVFFFLVSLFPFSLSSPAVVC